MPQPVARGGIIRVQLTGVPGSGPDYNTFHIIDGSAAITLAAFQAAVTDLTAFYNAIKSLYPSGITITVGSSCEGLVPPVPIFPVTPSTVTSGVGNAVAAPQVCMIGTWRTALAGRAYRGRTYIGPLQASVVNGATPSSTWITTLQGAMTALLAAAASASVYDLAVYSRKNNTLDPVQSGVARGYFGTQRRRL
jgi:hypothetical protein